MTFESGLLVLLNNGDVYRIDRIIVELDGDHQYILSGYWSPDMSNKSHNMLTQTAMKHFEARVLAPGELSRIIKERKHESVNS